MEVDARPKSATGSCHRSVGDWEGADGDSERRSMRKAVIGWRHEVGGARHGCVCSKQTHSTGRAIEAGQTARCSEALTAQPKTRSMRWIRQCMQAVLAAGMPPPEPATARRPPAACAAGLDAASTLEFSRVD